MKTASYLYRLISFSCNEVVSYIHGFRNYYEPVISLAKRVALFDCSYLSLSVSNDSGQIFYDMKAVEDLLDRSNEGIEQKESSMNEYLSSFKVCCPLLAYLTSQTTKAEINL